MRPLPLFPVLALLPLPAAAASFDCTQSGLAPDEAAICADRGLNDMDVEMATLFRFLSGLFAMGTRGAMQDDQAAWLEERRQCGAETDCLRAAYQKRLDQLQAIYDGIDRPI